MGTTWTVCACSLKGERALQVANHTCPGETRSPEGPRAAVAGLTAPSRRAAGPGFLGPGQGGVSRAEYGSADIGTATPSGVSPVAQFGGRSAALPQESQMKRQCGLG